MDTRSVSIVAGMVEPCHLGIARDGAELPHARGRRRGGVWRVDARRGAVGGGVVPWRGRRKQRRHLRAVRLVEGDIAWADHQRHHQLVAAVDAGHGLRVLEGDLDRVARHQVGDLLGEHVGAVLLQEGGGLALALALLERLARLLALADLGLDHLVAHLHGHGEHRRVLVEREEVFGVEGRRRGVHEGLRHRHGGEVALDVGDHVGLEAGEVDGLAPGVGRDAAGKALIVRKDGRAGPSRNERQGQGGP